MKLTSILSRLSIKGGKLKTPILELNFDFNEADKEAAWILYIELITRVSTQELDKNSGDEKSALTSIYSLFTLSRDLLIKSGRECVEFSKLTVIILNYVLRPFTAKWHKQLNSPEYETMAITDKKKVDINNEFREELKELQANMRLQTEMLAGIIGIEDITSVAN